MLLSSVFFLFANLFELRKTLCFKPLVYDSLFKLLLFLFLSLFVSCQIRWTKTAGSATDRFQDSSVFNETLRITRIQRHQGGRYYCKAENGLGTPAIKSIRVDVYCELTSSSTRRQKTTHLTRVLASQWWLGISLCLLCLHLSLAFQTHTQPWFSSSLKSLSYKSHNQLERHTYKQKCLLYYPLGSLLIL